MATKVIKKITIDLLTQNSVSVITEKFATVEGVKQQVGKKERKAYSNSPIGRQQILEMIGEPYCTSIFSIWGNSPTVEDPPSLNETEDE